MKRSDPPDAGHAAIDLLRRWQAHELGGVASSNTLFAVFGVARRPGASPTSPHTTTRPIRHGSRILPTITGSRFLCAPRVAADLPHSPGAAAMVEHGLSRGGGRRVAMTAAAEMALLGYYREKIVLLSEIRAVVEGRSRRMLVRRHLGACVALLERLGGSPAPTPPAA